MQGPAGAVTAWCYRHRFLVAIAVITLLAAVVRFYRIESFPPGLHGDEAWTGIDARRVLQEGWIGPYVPSALGQPSGPLYWTALVFKLFGDGVLQLRLSMAALGVATVALTYFAAGQMFDRRAALLAGALLAFMSWHILFSRIAFMVIAQPMVEVAFLGTWFLAMKRQSYVLYAAAGAILGLGVYTYNAYPVFVAATAIVAIVIAAVEHRRWRRLAPQLGLMFLVAFVVALPLLGYIRDDKNDYLGHHRLISVLYKPEFEDAGLRGKAEVLGNRTLGWLKLVTLEPKIDYTDGTGVAATVDVVTLVLVLAGAGVCLRRRSPGHLALLIYLAVLPISAIITLDASVRRSLALTPIVAMLAALPLAAVWDWAEVQTDRARLVGRMAIAAVVVGIAVFNLRTYFGEESRSEAARWVFVEQLAAASKYIASRPNQPHVYFYASRWSYDYETRRYLAPDLTGENRSVEFGRRIVNGREQPPPVLDFDARVPSIVVLLPNYFDVLAPVQQTYPGGELYVGRNDKGETLFIAYTLPSVRR